MRLGNEYIEDESGGMCYRDWETDSIILLSIFCLNVLKPSITAMARIRYKPSINTKYSLSITIYISPVIAPIRAL